MYRKFIAGVIAAAVVVTTLGASPARADDKDVARAVAAILGIAIVGKIIHDRNKDRDEEAVTHRRPEPVYQPPRVHRPRDEYRPGGVHPRPLPDRVGRGDRRLLPGHCFRSYDTRHGPVRMFGEDCLQQTMRHANRLPQHCLRQVRANRTRIYGYEARCLRDAGYQLARS